MKTIDIEIAMMTHFGVRRNIIVPNVWWGMDFFHECDLIILSSSNYATEIEIKISKSDLLKEKEKHHNHESNKIKRLYFAVTEELKDIALTEIPERVGLFVVKKMCRKYLKRGRKNKYVGYCYYIVELIRKCKINNNAKQWTIEERYKLAELGTMRILGLKQKLVKMYNREMK